MRMFIKVSLFLGAMILAGCAALTGGNVAVTAGGQLVVQEATAFAIQSNCTATATVSLQQCYDNRAAKVLVIAQQLENVTVATASTEVSTLLQQALASLKLTPEEMVPLNVLVSNLAAYLQPLINTSPLITSSALAIVQQVAGWVADEAVLYSPVTASKVMTMKLNARTQAAAGKK